ncbi:MAG: hypothetical protein LC754_16610 [Acidobacteria bacterium]|nr:hypothetical protein [Acidobacteriota bacterium]
MRWKLLIFTSLLATLVGAGLSLAASQWLLSLNGRTNAPVYAALATLLIPLAAVAAAGIFVYRHTARRRPLQAMATALLAALLTLAALTAGSIYLARRAPTPTPTPTPANNIG